MNSMAHWLGGLVAVVVLCHANIGTIAAQEAATPATGIDCREAGVICQLDR